MSVCCLEDDVTTISCGIMTTSYIEGVEENQLLKPKVSRVDWS